MANLAIFWILLKIEDLAIASIFGKNTTKIDRKRPEIREICLSLPKRDLLLFFVAKTKSLNRSLVFERMYNTDQHFHDPLSCKAAREHNLTLHSGHKINISSCD